MPAIADITDGTTRCHSRSIQRKAGCAFSIPKVRMPMMAREEVHHPLNGEVGQEEAGDGNEGIGNKGRGAIKRRTPLDGGLNAGRKGQTPHNQRGADKERQGVEKSPPDFGQYRLAVLKRFQLAGCQVAQPIDILHGQGFVQMEGSANAGNILRLHARIGGVHLAGLTGREMDDREGDHRNNDQQNQALENGAQQKNPHESKE